MGPNKFPQPWSFKLNKVVFCLHGPHNSELSKFGWLTIYGRVNKTVSVEKFSHIFIRITSLAHEKKELQERMLRRVVTLGQKYKKTKGKTRKRPQRDIASVRSRSLAHVLFLYIAFIWKRPDSASFAHRVIMRRYAMTAIGLFSRSSFAVISAHSSRLHGIVVGKKLRGKY